MIGIIVIYFVVCIATISMGYHLHRCIKDKRIAADNLEKAVRDAYEDGYKIGFTAGTQQGFAAGAQQGYNDGKREAEIVAHNKKILRKAGIIK
jgi:hypothetical protein